MEFVFRNANVYTGGQIVRRDVVVSDGKIQQIGALPADDLHGMDGLNCGGKFLFPGFTDVHVHFREPGFSYKETISSGCAAAARGGYTEVCAMPNLHPVPDSAAHLEEELNCIRRDAFVKVRPYGALSVGEKGQELADLAGMAANVVGFSDDGKGVQDEALMRRAMREVRRLGKVIAAHCEEESLLHGGYIHDGAYARAHGHRGICSESEWRPIERDLALVRETGCPYHVCHISCAESVSLIRRAKAEGLPVSCETAPHYLALDDSMLEEDGRFKMNPPIRSRADREALLEGLADGTIDAIATDHAPHSAEEKSRGLAGSLMGVTGLECAFPVLYTTLVRGGVLPLERLLALLTDRPRAIFSLPPQMRAGDDADLTLFDLERVWTIDPARFASKGRSTPFAGRTVYGACLLTMVKGKIVYNMENNL